MLQTQSTTKQDFTNFLTDDRTSLFYNDINFTKTFKGDVARIKADGELVYKVHLTKRLLIVTDALFCTFNRDEYWDVAKMANLEEVLADADTLIRI